MEDILRAIALGVIQGLTEFLPVSSSGHLIVARELFGWEFADDLTFDVALHLRTTAAGDRVLLERVAEDAAQRLELAAAAR